MRRLAQVPPEFTFMYSDYSRGWCRTFLGSWFTCTPYAVDCQVQVIGGIVKNGKYRPGVKLICLQIAICNRACWGINTAITMVYPDEIHASRDLRACCLRSAR